MKTLSYFALRGREGLNDRRKAIINLAFNTMDKDGHGMIEPELLLSTYQVSKHPDVVSRKISEDAALRDFLNDFDVGTVVEGQVTRQEFENYYTKISATVDEDDSFDLLIRSTFGIKGNDIEESSAQSRLLSQKQISSNRNVNFNTESNRLDAEQAYRTSNKVLNKLTTDSSNVAHLSNGMVQQLHNNKEQESFQDNNSRAIAYAGPNAFQVKTVLKDKFSIPGTDIPAGVGHILSKLRSQLRSHGAYGYVALQRTFRSLDKSIDGYKRRLGMSDFKYAVQQMNLDLSDPEVRMLFDYFDVDSRGSLDCDHFIDTVRNPLCNSRINIVKQAFAKLDMDGKGCVDASSVASVYDASTNPDVIAGRTTVDNSLTEFLETFDVGGEVEFKVTLAEFINYYTNIGATVDNDEYFKLIVRNAWHLRGEEDGSGVKRVLVTRIDGSQYVETISDNNGSAQIEVTSPSNGVHKQTFDIFEKVKNSSYEPVIHSNAMSRPLIEK